MKILMVVVIIRFKILYCDSAEAIKKAYVNLCITKCLYVKVRSKQR